MSLTVVFVTIVAIIVFGPGFIGRALLGYLVGTLCGNYASKRMRELHCAICDYTGDPKSDIDDLCKYVTVASKIGGIVWAALPILAIIVGIYCSHKAEKLRMLMDSKASNAPCELAKIPAFSSDRIMFGRVVSYGARL